jgi:hypothetical protein
VDSSSQGRCGEIASDLSIVVITAAQWVFFTYWYEYIAWPTKGPDGSLTWNSLLTEDYSRWLAFVTMASIIVIVASMVMIVYNRAWFRQLVWIVFSLLGITVTMSLLAIFPLDFGVIPNNTAAGLAPTVVKAILILMALFYTGSLIVQVRKLWSLTAGNRAA